MELQGRRSRWRLQVPTSTASLEIPRVLQVNVTSEASLSRGKSYSSSSVCVFNSLNKFKQLTSTKMKCFNPFTLTDVLK